MRKQNRQDKIKRRRQWGRNPVQRPHGSRRRPQVTDEDLLRTRLEWLEYIEEEEEIEQQEEEDFYSSL